MLKKEWSFPPRASMQHVPTKEELVLSILLTVVGLLTAFVLAVPDFPILYLMKHFI